MMRLGVTTQQTTEKKSYSFVYQDALDKNDHLDQVLLCTAEPNDLNVSPVLASDTRCRVWCDGGTNGTSYKVTLRVSTAGGEELEDELIIRVKDI